MRGASSALPTRSQRRLKLAVLDMMALFYSNKIRSGVTDLSDEGVMKLFFLHWVEDGNLDFLLVPLVGHWAICCGFLEAHNPKSPKPGSEGLPVDEALT
jgi:hypothetical protein